MGSLRAGVTVPFSSLCCSFSASSSHFSSMSRFSMTPWVLARAILSFSRKSLTPISRALYRCTTSPVKKKGTKQRHEEMGVGNHMYVTFKFSMVPSIHSLIYYFTCFFTHVNMKWHILYYEMTHIMSIVSKRISLYKNISLLLLSTTKIILLDVW